MLTIETSCKKKVQRGLTNDTQQAAEVTEQVIPIDREENTQVVSSLSDTPKEQQETELPQAETKHANPSETTPLTTIQQARNDVEKAQLYVQQAGALFIKGKSALPEKFREARLLLTKAKESTLHLQMILNTDSSLPEPLKSKKIRIIAQINIIYEQIDRLLYGLNRSIQGDSGSLNDALSKIQEFISN